MTKTVKQKVGIASLIMMSSVFLSRVIGLLREIVIAYLGGASSEVDAYQIAFVIPEILNHIAASGFLSITFIPILSYYFQSDQESKGWEVCSTILTTIGSIFLLLIMGCYFLIPVCVHWFAPGIQNSDVYIAAIRMTRIILPAQFFFFVGGIFMAVQFAKERFFMPALAPLIYNAGIIIGGILLNPLIGMEGFSWGVLWGAFLGNFVIQYFGARATGMKLSVNFQLNHPDLKKYIRLTLPLMLGLTMTFSTEIFVKFFGSFLPDGSIASLNYGIRVMFILVGIFGQAVGMASYPYLANLATQNKIPALNHLLNDTLRQYISLVIPFSILMVILRHEIIMILFQRGKFDCIAVHMTANVLQWLMVGAFAFAAQTIVVRSYYATQDTLFPTLFSTLTVILSIPIYWFGMQLMGISGVALAISLSTIIQVILLYTIWNKRSQNNGSRDVYICFLKVFIVSIILGFLMSWLKSYEIFHFNAQSFFGNLMTCVIYSIAYMFLLSVIAYIFKIDEIALGLLQIKQKILKK